MTSAMKNIAIIVAHVAIVAVVCVATVAAGIYLPRLWAEPAGRTEQIVDTNRGDYRTARYEKFYQLNEQIQATDTKLAAYPPDPTGRQQTECRGLLATRANLVSRYNAASRAETTSGQWRADDLPQTQPQENPRTC